MSEVRRLELVMWAPGSQNGYDTGSNFVAMLQSIKTLVLRTKKSDET